MNTATSYNQLLPIVLTDTRGRISLKMVCWPMGNDFVVTLSGGDVEHIGAVAVSYTSTNQTNSVKTIDKIATNVIVVPKHKEDILVKTIASLIAKTLSITVCVICGIHTKHILEHELKDIVEMSEEMTNNLILRLTI